MELKDTPLATERAGFWARVLAFVIDGLVLGMVGAVLGATMFEPLAQLGVWGRAVGFSIALLYFGVLNSHVTGGRTIGKRLMSLRTQRVDGELLSLPRSFARYSVLGLPWFLNGAPFPAEVLLSPAMYLLSLLIFGGLFTTLYLFLFNRQTRRVAHDYLVGSWVVKDRSPRTPVSLPKLWRVHVVVVAILVIGSLALPVIGKQLLAVPVFAQLMPAYKALSSTPGVQNAQVQAGWQTINGEQSTYTSIQAQLSSPNVDDEAFARMLAKKAIAVSPTLGERDSVRVTLTHGFDLGIASGWSAHGYAFEAADLAR
jgi:uncharacterized RDD family membrane protein YckC